MDNPVDDGRLVVDDGAGCQGEPVERSLDRGGPALAPADVLTVADVLRTDQPFPLVLPVGDIF
ncbi:hypothetical protein [Micromonospora sp. CA-244673]|uniref:hypothetical protein n=1 Tax=Micromonospora sp. CA-244673 TaxID=3239958 RepID=UPI003D8CEFAA